DQGVLRRAGENPLYDVSFFEMTAPEGAAAAGWSPYMGALPDGMTSAKNALSMAVHHGRDGTGVFLAYDTLRIERAAVERLAGHLQTLLLDVATHPDKRLSELLDGPEGATMAALWRERLSGSLPGAQAELLAAWNHHARPGRGYAGFHHAFE